MWSRQVVLQTMKRLERSGSASAFSMLDRLAAHRAIAASSATTIRNLSISYYQSKVDRDVKTSFNLIDPTTHDGLALTKIVATIGPTSEQAEPLAKVVKSGMKIMRLNFSHATTEEVELRLKNLALSQVSLRSSLILCISRPSCF